MEYGACSDIGQIRKNNEDSYLIVPPYLFMVADGMGGHEAGEIASSLAVKTIARYFEQHFIKQNDVLTILTEAVSAANQVIFDHATAKNSCLGMGTTITALCFHNSSVCWAHVGDSRAYLIRNRHLRQLTNDHSLVGELVRSGELTPEEAKQHPHRNILTRAVGTDTNLHIETGTEPLLIGDKFLLCTDGLNNMVDSKEIAAILSIDQTMQNAAEQLVHRANENGGVDNVTAIAVHYATLGLL